MRKNNMKRAALALTLIGVTGVANASLSFVTLAGGSNVARTEAFNTDNSAVNTALGALGSLAVNSTLNLGYLQADQAGTVKYSYLGQESGFSNKFYKLSVDTTAALDETSPWYTQIISVGMNSSGKLDYKFEGDSNKFAKNNVSDMSEWSTGTSIGLLGHNVTIGTNFYEYVIGYNDSAGATALGDWDDFVIGVNFVSADITTTVPEPETYAMLLAGLGLLGFAARRRKQKEAAAA